MHSTLRKGRGWKFWGDDPEWERQQKEKVEKLRREVLDALDRLEQIKVNEDR